MKPSGRALAFIAMVWAVAGCGTTSTEVSPSASLPVTAGWEQFFKLTWEAGMKNGGPVVDGYVLNDWGMAAHDVRLLVEALDANGQVVARTIGYVPLTVAPGQRAYFAVPVSTPAPAYRVSVMSWDWLDPPSRRRFP
jgi:hypothetical protein